MNAFDYQDGVLHADDVSLGELAERFGTPLYVYSASAIRARLHAFNAAFEGHDPLVCYAVKANANLGVLRLLATLGAGFDIVSGGELERVLQAGGAPERIVFSGVGKSAAEIRRALEVGIACFNVESAGELQRIESIATELQRQAAISVRVNPDVDAATHPYISTGLKENKFGVPIDEAVELYRHADESTWLDVRGIDCHIGSQLTQLEPFVDALRRLLGLVDTLAAAGIRIHHLDLGGGLGVRYRDEAPPAPEAYAQALLTELGERPLQLMFEPGRWLVGEAGVLLTRVEYTKDNGTRRFLVVDGAMNDLLRPALYGAWHDIVPVRLAADAGEAPDSVDVVGPVCESADFLGKDRRIQAQPGDVLAVLSAGAYSFGMASNYNTRNRPAEVMVDGTAVQLVRRRETLADQLRCELDLETPPADPCA